MNKKTQIFALLMELEDFYALPKAKRLNKTQIKRYTKALMRHEVHLVEVAVDRCCEKIKWMPKLPEILSLIPESEPLDPAKMYWRAVTNLNASLAGKRHERKMVEWLCRRTQYHNTEESPRLPSPARSEAELEARYPLIEHPHKQEEIERMYPFGGHNASV